MKGSPLSTNSSRCFLSNRGDPSKLIFSDTPRGRNLIWCSKPFFSVFQKYLTPTRTSCTANDHSTVCRTSSLRHDVLSIVRVTGFDLQQSDETGHQHARQRSGVRVRRLDLAHQEVAKLPPHRLEHYRRALRHPESQPSVCWRY